MAVQLRLGNSYVRRDGAVVEIVEIVEKKPGKKAPTQPYKCSEGKRYSANGSWKKDGTQNEWDLVREHVAAWKSVEAPRTSPKLPTSPRPATAAPAYKAPAPAERYDHQYTPAAVATATAAPSEKKNPMSKLFGRLFGGSIGQVTDNNFKMSLRGPAVRQPDGGYAAYDVNANAMTDVTEFLLDGGEEFLYKIPSPTVKPGDVVVIAEAPLDVIYVSKVDAATGEVTGLNPRSNRREIWQPQTNMLGVRFFIVLTSLVNFGNLAAGAAGGPDLFTLMALTGGLGGSSKGKSGGLSSILPILALSGGLGGANAGQAGALGSNPLLLMSLMGDKSEGGGMSDFVMLSMLSGGGGLGNLFGGAAQAAPVAPAAPAAEG